jgi:hypothetical protein
MADRQITPEFIESMVDRIIHEITSKLEQLDISMDYIAAGLMDGVVDDGDTSHLRRGLANRSGEKHINNKKLNI